LRAKDSYEGHALRNGVKLRHYHKAAGKEKSYVNLFLGMKRNEKSVRIIIQEP